MHKYQQLQTLKELVLQHKRLYIKDIVRLMQVSEATARRYINNLTAAEVHIQRIKNGVSVANPHLETEFLFEEKLKLCAGEKARIAKKAAELIAANHSLIIDSGSTCYFFAKELCCKNLKVITTDLNIAVELGKKKNISSLYEIGGEVRLGYLSSGGIIAAENLRRFHAQTAVMAADAIDFDSGITNVEIFEVPVKQEFRRRCQELILLADSSKFGKQSLFAVMPLSQVDIVITDANIPQEYAHKLREMGITVYIV